MLTTTRRTTRGASQVVTVLLLVIIASLLAIILIMVLGTRKGGDDGPGGPARKPAERGDRADKPQPPPPPPKPVGDPKRIRDVLQPGKTYESALKAGLQAVVIDEDWGLRTTVNLTYVAESRVRHTVEKNDGKSIVLLCQVLESRAAKLLADVDVRLNLGQPGFVLLGALDAYLTGGQGVAIAVPAAQVIEAMFTGAARATLEGAKTKAEALVDSLEGKKFRVTYVDGRGVTSLEPVGCELTTEQREYLKGMSVLGECYLLPDTESKPGDYWDVEAAALSDLLVPPTWRGRPSGVVTVERGPDVERAGKRYAQLNITRGSIRVNASDASRRRLGSITPRGKLEYNITDGYVEQGELSAAAHMEDVSTDHLLFEARFETTPKMEIQYHCRRLGGAGGD